MPRPPALFSLAVNHRTTVALAKGARSKALEDLESAKAFMKEEA